MTVLAFAFLVLAAVLMIAHVATAADRRFTTNYPADPRAYRRYLALTQPVGERAEATFGCDDPKTWSRELAS